MVHKASTSTVQGLDALLFFALGWNELHVRLHQRGAYGFGVTTVVFLVLEKRFDVLWRDHFYRVAQS